MNGVNGLSRWQQGGSPMDIQAVQPAATQPKSTFSPAADEVKNKRENYVADIASEEATSGEKKAIQPEELLNNIKALTEDGVYSVRFEMHKDTQDLIINLVDTDSGELIRQIPPEEIVNLHKQMQDLRGNIVSVES